MGTRQHGLYQVFDAQYGALYWRLVVGFPSHLSHLAIVLLTPHFVFLPFVELTNSLIGLVAASMSTADGAILAMGTVWSHNITRQLDKWYPSLVTSDNLIRAAQLSTVPFTLAAALIATHSQKTGYLLIVALYVPFRCID
jgi:Na+(H+)/acetate symporter ActP